MNDMPVDVGEAAINSVLQEGQALVVDPHEM
jgi:hypothetical protein